MTPELQREVACLRLLADEQLAASFRRWDQHTRERTGRTINDLAGWAGPMPVIVSGFERGDM